MPYGIVNTDTVRDSNGGILAPISSVFRNRIINGAMVIDQRNAGASLTFGTGTAYTVDRWFGTTTASNKISIQQNAGAVTPPVGFNYYLGVTSLTAYSVSAGDTFFIQQSIEGFNTADLDFGKASAKTITLSFQVYSSLTGTFGGALINSAANRAYPFSYSVPVANTWTPVSVTVAGDITGTWVGATNGMGLGVRFGLGSGSTYSGTAGSWAAGNLVQPTGTVSVVGTNGATFYITGVQLEVGSSATGFEYRQYGAELLLCQRYYEKQQVYQYGSIDTSSTISSGTYVRKRTTPSVTVTANNGYASLSAGFDGWAAYTAGQTNTQFVSQVISSAEL